MDGSPSPIETVTVPGPLDPCGPYLLPGEYGFNPVNAIAYRLCKLESAAIGGVSAGLRAFIDELWLELQSFFVPGTVLGDALASLHAGIDTAWQWLGNEIGAVETKIGDWLFPVTVIALAFFFSPELRRAIAG